MSESIVATIKRAAIAAIRRHVFTLEFAGFLFTLESIGSHEYAIMTEINNSPLCVAHVYA